MSLRKLGLLALILGFGLAVEATHQARASWSLGPAGCRILTGRFHGPSFDFESPALALDLEGIEGLEVTNAFGHVRVVSTDGVEPVVVLRTVVYRAERDEASGFAERITLHVEPAGSVLRIGTNRDALERREDVGFETHLELRLPEPLALSVRNAHGAVSVDGASEVDVESSFERVEVRRVEGSVKVRAEHSSLAVGEVGGDARLATRHGDVELRSVSGAAEVDVEHGSATLADLGALSLTLRHGSVQLGDVRGDAAVNAEHAGVRAARIGGALDVRTSYDAIVVEEIGAGLQAVTRHGRIEAKGVTGGAYAEASYADVALEGIAGEVEARVSHGGLRISRLHGGLRAFTSGDDVSLRGIEGPVHVEAGRGSVRLAPGAPLAHPIDVSVDGGDVRVELPRGSPLRLEATAARGGVDVSVTGLERVESGERRVVGHVGADGPGVRLRTRQGRIQVLDAESAPDGPATLRGEVAIR